MKRNWRVNRRHFLYGAGGVAIGLPTLEAMLFGEQAHAQANKRRFMLWGENNGNEMTLWRPEGNENNFEFGPMHKSLEPYKDYILVLAGLDNIASMRSKVPSVHQGNAGICTGGYNALGGRWTGDGGKVAGDGKGCTDPTCYSVDQRIAADPRYQGLLKDKFTSYGFGIQVSDIPGTVSRISYKYQKPNTQRDANKKIDIKTYPGAHVESNPKTAFKDLFGGLPTGQAMPGTGGTLDEQREAAKRIARKRASVLDHVGDRFNSLKLRVGAEDKQRLNEHLELVRKLEKDVASIPDSIANAASSNNTCSFDGSNLPSGRQCAERDQGTSKGAKNVSGCRGQDMGMIGQAQMDLLHMSFKCDLMRVGTLQWSSGGNRVSFGFLSKEAGERTHHDLSHRPNKGPLGQIHTWYAEQMASMLKRLKETVEPDGTNMLDNTAIGWVNELAWGRGHTKNDVPMMLIGKGGGAFDTGRFLEFKGSNRTNIDLWLQVLHSYGIMDDHFGDPDAKKNGWLKGPLTEIT